jgi:hypothetical protein
MARPTKYTPELLKLAKSYLTEWEAEGDMIPSVEGLSAFINIARSTLYVWAEEKPLFSDILQQINEKQSRTLINKGLSGDFNSNITKLVLGKHGYSEKQDTKITGQLDTQATYSPEVHRFDGSTDTSDT